MPSDDGYGEWSWRIDNEKAYASRTMDQTRARVSICSDAFLVQNWLPVRRFVYLLLLHHMSSFVLRTGNLCLCACVCECNVLMPEHAPRYSTVCVDRMDGCLSKSCAIVCMQPIYRAYDIFFKNNSSGCGRCLLYAFIQSINALRLYRIRIFFICNQNVFVFCSGIWKGIFLFVISLLCLLFSGCIDWHLSMFCRTQIQNKNRISNEMRKV